MADLILSTSSAPSKFSFKDAKLNDLSAKISTQIANMNALVADARERAERINSALAPLFGEVMTSKCYEKDGFKSVADYAEATFNIGRSMAYLLARVGRDYYNDDNDYTKAAREALTVSRLDAMGAVDRVALAKAIEDGEITPETSLDDCRAFGASHRKAGKEPKAKVVHTFDLHAMPANGGELLASNVVKDDFLSALVEAFGASSEHCGIAFVTLPVNADSAAKHGVFYTSDGACRMFEYRPHALPKKAKGKKSGEKFDLMAYLASLTPEQLSEFARSEVVQNALNK